MNWREELDEFKKSLMDRHLSLCDERQQAFFHRLFPDGPPADDYSGAMDLIARTIAKNETKAKENV